MDGVLWRGETPLADLPAFFAALRRLDIGFVLATNNAAKTAEQYTQKLARFGVAVETEQILSSALATAEYLSQRYEEGTAVFIVGDDGLHQAHRDKGFRIITPAQAYAGETADVVIAGFYRGLTYNHLAMAVHLILQGAAFIGSNPDLTYPHEIGILPGAGATLAYITAATGVHPTIIGKPEPIIFQTALRRLGGDPAHTVMVGDRLNTDISGAQATGLQTILVLTGISTREDIAATGIQPDHILPDITALAEKLVSLRVG
jgi:4-nitrophenyl phosphatase